MAGRGASAEKLGAKRRRPTGRDDGRVWTFVGFERLAKEDTMRRRLCLLAVAGLVLAGCGDTRGERTITGAGIGAGAGAVLGAVTGMGVVTGTIAGAAVGGVTGMVTDKSQINIGDPSGPQSSSAQAQPADQAAAPSQPAEPQQQAAYAPADRETVVSIQTGLARLGFDPGPADGIAGTRTRAAIRAFQQQNGLPADGEPTRELEQKIQQQIAARGH